MERFADTKKSKYKVIFVPLLLIIFSGIIYIQMKDYTKRN